MTGTETGNENSFTFGLKLAFGFMLNYQAK